MTRQHGFEARQPLSCVHQDANRKDYARHRNAAAHRYDEEHLVEALFLEFSELPNIGGQHRQS
jgi:hypothetical protein